MESLDENSAYPDKWDEHTVKINYRRVTSPGIMSSGSVKEVNYEDFPVKLGRKAQVKKEVQASIGRHGPLEKVGEMQDGGNLMRDHAGNH